VRMLCAACAVDLVNRTIYLGNIHLHYTDYMKTNHIRRYPKPCIQ